jgi:hypothetical protein
MNISDARWFPVDMHVPNDEIFFLKLDELVLEKSAFLDTRIKAPLGEAIKFNRADLVLSRSQPIKVGFLFHTSFCCSSLIANILSVSDYSTSLKEPLVLRRLADAKFNEWDIDSHLFDILGLLSRPWFDQGINLIKPTHVALNLAARMISLCGSSSGIVVTSTLLDFLVSNIKKNKETQQKVPELVRRALSSSSFAERLPTNAAPETFLELVALQWAAQWEVIGDLLLKNTGRVKLVFNDDFLSDPDLYAEKISRFLGMQIPENLLNQSVVFHSNVHAKDTAHSYSSQQRKKEFQYIHSQYQSEITAAIKWADKALCTQMHSLRLIESNRL